MTTAAPSRTTLEQLPRAGMIDVLRGIGRLFRPGAHGSPLGALGDRFTMHPLGFPACLVTQSPDDTRALFSDRSGALSFAETLRRFTPHEPLFGSDSFIFMEGEDHVRERRRVSPPFHGQALRSYEEAIAEIARRRVAQWPTGRPLDFLTLGHQLALDVMMTVIFGVSQRDRMRRLEHAMRDYGGVAESPAFLGLGMLSVILGGRWIPTPGLGKAETAVDSIVLEEIEERRRGAAGTPRDDVLAMFLGLAAQEAGGGIDDRSIARAMRGLMLAGLETTAITLAWIAEMLVHHEDELAAVTASVDRGEDDRLDAVVAETLRLRPVLPYTGRRALADIELDGLAVPAGTMIIVAIMALHERPDLYPEPRTFRPARFLGTRPGTYTWLPFGGGPHRCLGASFAQFEARVLFRTLLQHRRLRAAAPGRGGRCRATHPLLVPADARVVLEVR
jgi:cytochrome P450